MLTSLDKTKTYVIELREVGFRYEDASHDAITDVTLEIAPAESIAILGGSDAGKTTLLLALTNRLQSLRYGHLHGVIRQSETAAALPKERQPGVVLQDPEPLFFNLR